MSRETEQLKEEHLLLKEKSEVYNNPTKEGLFVRDNPIIKEANHAFEKLKERIQAESVNCAGAGFTIILPNLISQRGQ